jgi:hypothetical protein
MACVHKFFNDINHLSGENGLIPNWEIETLFIGTFNPSIEWNTNNNAAYFYGRSRNNFWKLLSEFSCNQIPIERNNYDSMINFLKQKKIGLTDIIIRINDADLNNQHHIELIRKFRDHDLDRFKDIEFNTKYILKQLALGHIKQVYFTRSVVYNGSIENNILEIENYCKTQNILFARLNTPSGQGLGSGRPRLNKLIHKWYEQGVNNSLFSCTNFNIQNYPWR